MSTSGIPSLFTFETPSPVPCRLSHVYDGDSMRATFQFRGEPTCVRIRISGIDTPELRANDPATKTLARKARQVARSVLCDDVHQVTLGKFDKYGRVLADITLSDGRSYGEFMCTSGLAVAYDGGTKPVAAMQQLVDAATANSGLNE